MALDQYALITATAGLSYAGAGTSAEDIALIEDLINAATDYIENSVGRKIKARSYTEYHSGGELGSLLFTKQYPVRTITSIHDDPARDFTAVSEIPTSDYYADLEDGCVELLAGNFQSGVANVKIIYNAGYGTVPYVAEQACKVLVSELYTAKENQTWGVLSRSDGHGDSVTYADNATSGKTSYAKVEDILAPLKKMRL